MKTKQLYWEDCYQQEMDATVLEAQGTRVLLDQTVFCYAGGGQPSDVGVLKSDTGEFRVLEAVKEEGELWHVLDKEGLTEGDAVHGAIEWERRYTLMRNHTATHVLAAIMNREAGALIGGNQLDVEKSRIDFTLDNFDREKYQEYVDKANKALASGIDIKMYFLPRDEALAIPGAVKLAGAAPPDGEQLHMVEIGAIDLQADGGTHVANTTECGTIEILKLENKGKGRKRVYFTLR